MPEKEPYLHQKARTNWMRLLWMVVHRSGAITGVTTVKNPMSLARIVMEESRHIFFSGQGAERYADQTDVERVENDYFFTQNRYDAWQRAQGQSMNLVPGNSHRLIGMANDEKFGTVGAVALDMDGNLAAATSTGGMTNKQFGRVGDVPIIGSGTLRQSCGGYISYRMG